MAKSVIDVVQDSPRTGLGIPVKAKTLLPNHIAARAAVFQLRTSWDAGSGFMSLRNSSIIRSLEATILLFASLRSPLLSISRAKLTPHCMALFVLDGPVTRDSVFTEYNLWAPEGYPFRDQQRLGIFRSHFKGSAVQPTLCPPLSHWSSAPGSRCYQQYIRQVRHPASKSMRRK